MDHLKKLLDVSSFFNNSRLKKIVLATIASRVYVSKDLNVQEEQIKHLGIESTFNSSKM